MATFLGNFGKNWTTFIFEHLATLVTTSIWPTYGTYIHQSR